MDSLLNRIRRSLAVRGVIGTARLCAFELFFRLWPAARNAEAERQRVDQVFDSALGVDTGGIFRPTPDSVVGRNWSYGVNYQAVDPGGFLRALNEANLNFPEFTFLDLGCGKGRALLLASAFPFRRIVGVEYCVELHKTAVENISLPNPALQAGSIEVHRMDAVEFPIPDEPLLIFLYNPFSEAVMSPIISKLVASFRRHPRRMVLIYFTPEFKQLWLDTGIFQVMQTDPLILDTGLVAPLESPTSSPSEVLAS